ncbi:MAG: T9SS type A sorting domain-containing protein [Bacteroidetes bacterium]|nr:T9SS type A sorting domain-containing protein [Bacteroidota bacterium]
MKKNVLQGLMLAALTMFATIANAANVNVTQPITSNTTWTNDNTYTLYGDIIVKNNAVLTIQPGTVIKGDKVTLSRLVIATGAKLIAQGTPNQPIVFTSNQAAGQRTRADWAGIAICGLAPVNFKDANNQAIQGRIECGSTTDYDFGGNNAEDSSGVISYVRIEYAGYVCGTNSELNSLTLGGVGSKTKIDHVMVSYGQDDGFEFFGGTVNASHLISLALRDDDFDTDNGWSGKVQYGLIVRNDTIADQGDVSNAFESDNDANGSTNTPFTGGVFSNVTVIGPAATTTSVFDPKFGWGARLRRNTSLSIFNSAFIGYKRGLRIEGAAAQTNATNGDLNFKYNVIAGTVEAYGETAFDSTYINTPANAVKVYGGNANDSVMLYAPYSAPNYGNYVPQSGSPLLAGADFTNGKLSGLETTAFRGAFGTSDWTACWAEFSPNDEVYTSSPINYGFAVDIAQSGNAPSADLNVTVPAGNYTFSWSTGATTQNITVANNGDYTVTVTSPRGCTVSNTITVVTTGVAEISNINSISLYPNPAKGLATLELALTENVSGNITVTDLAGKVMLAEAKQFNSGMNLVQINTADFANGMYLVNVRNGAESKTIRMVVNK